MNKLTLESVFALRQAMEIDPAELRLKEAENALNSSEEIQKLSQEVKKALSEYDFALSHFGEESPQVQTAQRALYLAKKELDEHPLAMAYSQAFSEIRKRDAEIDAILFAPFRLRVVCGGKHD